MSTLAGTSLYVVPSSVGSFWVCYLYTLNGQCLVVANEGQRIDIPDGCILENRTLAVFRNVSYLLTMFLQGLLSGNLNMIVRLIFPWNFCVYRPTFRSGAVVPSSLLFRRPHISGSREWNKANSIKHAFRPCPRSCNPRNSYRHHLFVHEHRRFKWWKKFCNQHHSETV